MAKLPNDLVNSESQHKLGSPELKCFHSPLRGLKIKPAKRCMGPFFFHHNQCKQRQQQPYITVLKDRQKYNLFISAVSGMT